MSLDGRYMLIVVAYGLRCFLTTTGFCDSVPISLPWEQMLPILLRRVVVVDDGRPCSWGISLCIRKTYILQYVANPHKKTSFSGLRMGWLLKLQHIVIVPSLQAWKWKDTLKIDSYIHIHNVKVHSIHKDIKETTIGGTNSFLPALSDPSYNG